MFGEPGTDMDRSESKGTSPPRKLSWRSASRREEIFSEIAWKKGLLGNPESQRP